MTRVTRALALALAGSMAVGCGGPGTGDEQRAEQAAQQAEAAADTAERAAEEAAQGLEQMAKGLESLAAGAGADVETVDPVSFRELMALLPELDGWERQKPRGERMTSPVSFSQAEGQYTKGDSSIEVKIVDTGFNQLLLTPYAMFLAAGYERESSEGHEKSTKVNGQPGCEKWNSESRDGELNALVGKRFLVTIDGRGIENVGQLHDLAGRIDMGKLASLK